MPYEFVSPGNRESVGQEEERERQAETYGQREGGREGERDRGQSKRER